MDAGAVRAAQYHLPGLFEFYELYRRFLPLFFEHRDYFYPWCDIGSIYGAPADCLWGGGRVGFGDNNAGEVAALLRDYGVSARLTFSNSLLQRTHLTDRQCNALCDRFSRSGRTANGVIVASDLLTDYLRERYPALYLVSSTTKVITDFSAMLTELDREAFRFIVPDFRLNKRLSDWATLSQPQRDKVELLCNECCDIGCTQRRACYEAVSHRALGEDSDHVCLSPHAREGYVFSRAMQGPAFIGIGDITEVYLPLGIHHFKIEGRSLGSALVLELLLYYMVRPEHQLKVRERIYLDHSLDLF